MRVTVHRIYIANILVTWLCRIQRLGVDLTKAAESLRAWGVGEGDDLVVSHDFFWVCYMVQLLFSQQQSCKANRMHSMFRDTQIRRALDK